MPFGGRIVLPSKKAGETVNVVFNFLSALAPPYNSPLGVVSASVTATVYSGTDPNPAALINGAATVGGSAAEEVTQSITAGLPGVVYNLVCTALTSGVPQLTLKQSALLAIEPTAEGTP